MADNDSKLEDENNQDEVNPDDFVDSYYQENPKVIDQNKPKTDNAKPNNAPNKSFSDLNKIKNSDDVGLKVTADVEIDFDKNKSKIKEKNNLDNSLDDDQPREDLDNFTKYIDPTKIRDIDNPDNKSVNPDAKNQKEKAATPNNPLGESADIALEKATRDTLIKINRPIDPKINLSQAEDDIPTTKINKPVNSAISFQPDDKNIGNNNENNLNAEEKISEESPERPEQKDNTNPFTKIDTPVKAASSFVEEDTTTDYDDYDDYDYASDTNKKKNTTAEDTKDKQNEQEPVKGTSKKTAGEKKDDEEDSLKENILDDTKDVAKKVAKSILLRIFFTPPTCFITWGILLLGSFILVFILTGSVITNCVANLDVTSKQCSSLLTNISEEVFKSIRSSIGVAAEDIGKEIEEFFVGAEKTPEEIAKANSGIPNSSD